MLGIKNLFTKITTGAMLLFFAIPPAFSEGPEGHQELPANVRKVPHDKKAFRPDPSYEDKPYDPAAQLKIYGAKFAVETPRPLIELGRKLYDSGPIPEAFTFLGVKNPIVEHFMIFGDAKAAIAYHDGQNNIENQQQGVLAFQVNLELDLAFTATERIHALIQPVNQAGDFTRWEFAGDNTDFDTNTDANFDTLFFEGDVGAILSGLLNEDMGFDLAFAFGLMPILFQNGVWLEDAFTGVAVTVPAMNVPSLDISNMDVTFFVGLDKVDNNQVLAANDQDLKIFGLNMFIEANQGYWEVGYAYTYDDSSVGEADYHNLTVAFTRRYGGIISNSFRVIYNFGQKVGDDTDLGEGLGEESADGVLILIENSLISPLPLTLVPYFNLFVGFNRAQSLARAGAAGGVLKNTGINFETDNLTGFPKLDDTGEDTYGGAIGIEYLFDPFNLDPDRATLNGQIVVELAMVRELEGGNTNIANEGDQYAVGIRMQQPISQATILRMDAVYIIQEDDDDIAGVRFEVRRKF